jgi:hypothetical protein
MVTRPCETNQEEAFMPGDISRICAGYSHFSRHVELWFLKDDKQIARLNFLPYEQNCFVDPSLKLTNLQAQALMDQLWQCGLRPTEGNGSAGSLAATERHLADMRAIVSRCLKTEL